MFQAPAKPLCGYYLVGSHHSLHHRDEKEKEAQRVSDVAKAIF